MSNHKRMRGIANPTRVLRLGLGGAVLAGGILLGAGCRSLLPVGDDDGIDDRDLQVELGTAAESPADLYVNMASAYLQRGQVDAALTRAKQAVREDRNSARAHYILAIVYQRIGEGAEAEKEFQKAVQLDPKNPDYRNAWGVVLCKQQRYKDADKQFQQALEKPLYATPEVALTNAADCAKRAGDTTAAERYWRQALEKNPSFGPALIAMAEQTFNQGDAKAAREYVRRYAGSGSVATPKALLLAVRIERALGNNADAKTLETSLRQHFPDAAEIMEL